MGTSFSLFPLLDHGLPLRLNRTISTEGMLVRAHAHEEDQRNEEVGEIRREEHGHILLRIASPRIAAEEDVGEDGQESGARVRRINNRRDSYLRSTIDECVRGDREEGDCRRRAGCFAKIERWRERLIPAIVPAM